MHWRSVARFVSRELILDVPRQQLTDAADGQVGDAFEDVLELGFGIDAVE